MTPWNSGTKALALCFLTTLMFLFQSGEAPAAILLDWGSTRSAASTNLAVGSSVDNGHTRTWLDVKSSTKADYTGAPIRAMLEQSTDNSSPADLAIAKISAGAEIDDILVLKGIVENPGSATIRGLIYFQKADFLNGGNNEPISLADHSTLTLNIRKANGTTSVRMAVLQGSQWYISDVAFNIPAAGDIVTLTDLSSHTWGAWSPIGGALPALPESYSVATSTLTDIQAFGFYFEATRNNAAPEINITGFKVDAEVGSIPEPSLALLSGFGLLALGCWQRYRNKPAK